jgi:hypothetical protein
MQVLQRTCCCFGLYSLLLSPFCGRTSNFSASPGAMRCVCSTPMSLNQRVAGGLTLRDRGPALFRFVTFTVADATPPAQAKSSDAGVTAS